ncbi:hypothetical protein L915_04829, partial [Phytophthora nicotianae]
RNNHFCVAIPSYPRTTPSSASCYPMKVQKCYKDKTAASAAAA